MTSLFLSPGGDPFAHIKRHAAKVEAAAFQGVWGTVELQPDLFSPQKFSIGVVVSEPSGEFAFRLISDTKKFECVYGKATAALVRTHVESAEHSLLRSVKNKVDLTNLVFESGNLSLSVLWPTSGVSPQAVLARLFADVVAMEPSQEKAARDFVSLDTEQVRSLVSTELKRIAGLNYERIALGSEEILVKDDVTEETHVLDLNLRTDVGAGSVTSAVYKTPATVELNLLRASRDLSVFGRLKKVENLALFVMSAKEEFFEAPDFARISNLLDEQSWRLERQGFRVVIFDEPQPLAQSIYEWAGV